MSRKDPPQTIIDTSLPPPKKRTESDETVALRALRELRKLDEREMASHKRHGETLEAIDAERITIKRSLTGPQAALIAAMQAARNGAGQ